MTPRISPGSYSVLPQHQRTLQRRRTLAQAAFHRWQWRLPTATPATPTGHGRGDSRGKRPGGCRWPWPPPACTSWAQTSATSAPRHLLLHLAQGIRERQEELPRPLRGGSPEACKAATRSSSGTLVTRPMLDFTPSLPNSPTARGLLPSPTRASNPHLLDGRPLHLHQLPTNLQMPRPSPILGFSELTPERLELAALPTVSACCRRVHVPPGCRESHPEV